MHYKRNILYFGSIDIIAWVTLLASVAGGGVMIVKVTQGGGWPYTLGSFLMMAICLGSVMITVITSKKSYIQDCVSENRRTLRKDIDEAYGMTYEESSASCAFLKLLPPPSRHSSFRDGNCSYTYLLGVVPLENRLSFDIRGMSLVSGEHYQSRVRISLDEIKGIELQPEGARAGSKTVTLRILGLDGETRFSCRCLQGYEVDDCIGFVNKQIEKIHGGRSE